MVSTHENISEIWNKHMICQLLQLYVSSYINLAFLAFFDVFFSSRFLVRSCTAQDKVRDLPWHDYNVSVLPVDAAPFCYRLRLLQFPPTIELRTSNNRIGRIPPRFVTGNICLLVFCFFVFKPIFVLAFIAAQTAAAAILSPRVESLAVMLFRVFAASILSAVLRERCNAKKLCRVRVASNGLIPRSPLATRSISIRNRF